MEEKYQKITVGGLLIFNNKALVVRRSEKEDILKRILQNYPKFSKRTLKEQNLAISEAANFAIGIIQSSLKGHYELPGGKIDFGENPEETLKREFREETNLEIKVKIPYRIFTYITHEGMRHTVDTVEIVYLVELKDDIKNLKLSDEHEGFKLITINEISDIKMSDEIKTNILEGFKIIK